MTKTMLMTIGVVMFLAGGAVLALFSGTTGTAVGTTAALAGLALVGWAWLRGRGKDEGG